MEIRLTRREKDVLKELLKNARLSDQEIARRLKTSRPTVFKVRRRLEEKKIIKSYFPIIDVEKLGFEIHAVILYRWKDYSKAAELEKSIQFIKAQPEVIVFIKGEGLGKTDMIISLHRDLKEYERFIRKLKYAWKDNIEGVEVFLSSIEGIFKCYELATPLLAKIEEKIIYSK